ncbi:MAG: OadG family protein [Desulfobacteraceae bacterium]
MLGIDAITANNGWAMAITGACIVMCGLALLSFVISQLHKIIALTEGKAKKHSPPTPEPASPAVGLSAADIDLLDDLPAAARFYNSLTWILEKSFPFQHFTGSVRKKTFLIPTSPLWRCAEPVISCRQEKAISVGKTFNLLKPKGSTLA